MTRNTAAFTQLQTFTALPAQQERLTQDPYRFTKHGQLIFHTEQELSVPSKLSRFYSPELYKQTFAFFSRTGKLKSDKKSLPTHTSVVIVTC